LGKGQKIPKKRVLLLGANGMLGSEISLKFSGLDDVEILTCLRSQLVIDIFGRYRRNFGKLITEFKPDYVVNCIGVNKNNKKLSGIIQQLVVNGIFPRHLAKKSHHYGYFMIQISTDGVFFGKKGGYEEKARKYPRSIYSFSKILGEKVSDSVLIIRCSIVGRSPVDQKSLSLFTWFQNLKPSASVSGYTNQRWNGVTTDYLAKLVVGLVQSEYRIGGVQHFIPSDNVSKAELLGFFKDVLKRSDIAINPARAKKSTNRDLKTRYPKENLHFWNLAGLEQVPTISELVHSSLSQ
jgi:dTDP-4-dehydrorhamnose reductase